MTLCSPSAVHVKPAAADSGVTSRHNFNSVCTDMGTNKGLRESCYCSLDNRCDL